MPSFVSRFSQALLWCVILCVTMPAGAQTLNDLRNRISEDLGRTHFAKSFTGLITASNEIELSGARYEIDNATNTELTVFSLPFQTVVPLEDNQHRIGIHLEGALGYARANDTIADIFQGAFPAAATSVDADWTTFSGLIGCGLEFEVVDGLRLTPIVNLGLAHIDSDADFGGPGSALTAALTNGIAYNWDAWVVSYGVAGRADYTTALTDKLDLELIARYDIRWSETLETDDSAQDFATTSQMLTLRADLTGPTGLKVYNRDIDWRATVGYRNFIEGDLYGVQHIVQVGGALEISDDLPLGSTLSLAGAVFVGDDLTGWSLALSIGF